MSGLEYWLETINAAWKRWRMQFTRLTPGPKIKREQLESDDALIRWQAIRTLAQHPQIQQLSTLLILSGDPDAMVRAEVVNALASWGADVALKPVQQALAEAQSPASAAALLETLARLPAPANRDVIQPWLADEDVHVRAAAFMALAALCDDDDLPRLEETLKGDDIQVQRAILTALCAPEAGLLAEKAARSTDPILRQRGAQAAARIQRRREVRDSEQQAGQRRE
jgi:HEAT repeat protein